MSYSARFKCLPTPDLKEPIKAEEQHHGLGSEIVADLCASLKAHGFEKVRLAVDHGNPQSLAFWQKNGFSLTNEDGRYRPMEQMLIDR